MLQLLRHGSYLGITNIYGETPIKRILPVHLEAFFDSVVQCSNEEPSSHNFRVTFNYSFLWLAPPVKELKANIPLRYSSLLKNVDAEVESRTDQIEDIPQHSISILQEEKTCKPESIVKFQGLSEINRNQRFCGTLVVHLNISIC